MCHQQRTAIALAAAAVAIGISSSPASGFVPATSTSSFRGSTSLEKKNRRFRLDPNHVIIYGWDGEIEEDDSGSPAGSNTLLAERITQDKDRTASLARLAAAFSPPERALNVEHITDVSVVDVTHGHIELAALVCDGTSEGCVSLFVPVNFKHECPPVGFDDHDDELESCIRTNIDALDVEAELALLQKKARQNEENMGGLFGIYGDSLSTPDDFRP